LFIERFLWNDADMTQKPNRTLFREHALQHYTNRSAYDSIPRIISPPVFLFAWMLLILVMLSGWFAWMERVPVFVSSSGVAQLSGQKSNAHDRDVDIVIFVPTTISMQVHTGMRAKAQLNASSPYFDGNITNINSLVLSPLALQKQYQLTCRVGQEVLVPSVIAHMVMVVPANMLVENGARVQVQIQTGSQRVVDLLPLFQQFTGDS
jgi:hypothetical protein